MKLKEKTESNFRSRKADRERTENFNQGANFESNSAEDSLDQGVVLDGEREVMAAEKREISEGEKAGENDRGMLVQRYRRVNLAGDVAAEKPFAGDDLDSTTRQKRNLRKASFVIGGTILILALGGYGVPRLQDEMHWHQVTQEDTAQSYADYWQKRPQGRHAVEAQILLGNRTLAEALAKAVQVVAQAQKTQNRADWEAVVSGWEAVIEKLQEVPEISPSFVKAQQKGQEYQKNLEYAQIKAIDTYPEAYAQAMQVTKLAEKAQNQADWEEVVSSWEAAIEQMKGVPEKTPNFAKAQQKAREYQNNLKYARSKVTDYLVIAGAGYLDGYGQWTNSTEGYNIYQRLQNTDKQLVIDSLVRRVRHRQNRLQVLFLGIKLGIPGSEKALNNALFRYGDEYMALDYLNCGSPELDKGGRQWAYAHGYQVIQSKCGLGTGVECPGGVKWGQF